MKNCDVLVIGGGVVGAGIMRDLAMRGVDVMLIEKGDLCSGTSGRCNGLLHSGARYAVNNQNSAKECMSENKILKKIVPHTIENCGGLFASIPGDDLDYKERFIKGCGKCGIPAEEITPREALSSEKSLNPAITSAIRVPDASIDPFQLVLCNVLDALEKGAGLKTYTEAIGFQTQTEGVQAVRVKHNGQVENVKADFVINAAGPWASENSKMAGMEIPTNLDKGVMLVANGRLTQGVMNRLRMPTDGDIILPNHTTSILGTTSSIVSKPDDTGVSRDEVQLLISEISKLIPSVKSSRILRGFAGIRPLSGSGGSGREISRDFTIHKAENFITIIGGKLTTYRLMAERVSDMVCKELGVRARCRTAEEEISADVDVKESAKKLGLFQLQTRRAVSKHGHRIKEFAAGCSEIVCPCEFVSRGEIHHAVHDLFGRNIEDVMRRTRTGMGPCQGRVCATRIAALLCEEQIMDAMETHENLLDFLQERWKGIEPIMNFEQMRQERLFQATYACVGNYDRLFPGRDK